jgi:hypothetical protein
VFDRSKQPEEPRGTFRLAPEVVEGMKKKPDEKLKIMAADGNEYDFEPPIGDQQCQAGDDDGLRHPATQEPKIKICGGKYSNHLQATVRAGNTLGTIDIPNITYDPPRGDNACAVCSCLIVDCIFNNKCV